MVELYKLGLFEVVLGFGAPFGAAPEFVALLFGQDTDRAGADFNVVLGGKLFEVAGQIRRKANYAVA